MNNSQKKNLKENFQFHDIDLQFATESSAAEKLQVVLQDYRIESFALTNEELVVNTISKIKREDIKKIIIPDSTSSVVEFGRWRGEVAKAGAGITSARAIVKETGSLLMSSGIPDQRIVSLLPPHHIVIVSESQLVETINDLENYFSASDSKNNRNVETERNEMGFPVESGKTAMNKSIIENHFIVTGPSRTADIEKELVLGVHGPTRLTIIIIED